MEHSPHIQAHRPLIAIIDPNTLAAIGLKQLLQNVMPVATIDVFGSMAELTANRPERYVHYFVAMNVVLENRPFFASCQRRTIVLTLSIDDTLQLSGFHSLCINQPERGLLQQLLTLVQHAHGQGHNLPPMPSILTKKLLTDREIEVMALVAQGLINKEIADRLNIGLTTVITHRKNIMDKLGLKSVSALTIYAVMHGYVDVSQI